MLITVNQVADRLGVNKATIWKYRRSNPGFPQPVRLSAGCTRWHAHDIDAWIHEREVEALFAAQGQTVVCRTHRHADEAA